MSNSKFGRHAKRSPAAARYRAEGRHERNKARNLKRNGQTAAIRVPANYGVPKNTTTHAVERAENASNSHLNYRSLSRLYYVKVMGYDVDVFPSLKDAQAYATARGGVVYEAKRGV